MFKQGSFLISKGHLQTTRNSGQYALLIATYPVWMRELLVESHFYSKGKFSELFETNSSRNFEGILIPGPRSSPMKRTSTKITENVQYVD